METLNKQQKVLLAACKVSEQLSLILKADKLEEKDALAVMETLASSYASPSGMADHN